MTHSCIYNLWLHTRATVRLQGKSDRRSAMRINRDQQPHTYLPSPVSSGMRILWWSRACSCPRMSVDILGTNCDQCRSTVQCCFTSTKTIRLVRTESPGRPPRLSHSSWTLRILLLLCCLMSSDVGWHIGDKLRPMLKLGSILLYVHGNHKARYDGKPRTAAPPRLSHSSWTLGAYSK